MTTHRTSIVGAVQPLLLLGCSDTAASWLLGVERVFDGDADCFVDRGLRPVSPRRSA